MIPLISICIPAFNESMKLERCIKSVLIQTYSNFEIIITDDSDNGEIEQMICNYYSGESRIKYFKNKVSLGTPRNWNFSIEKASGYYIKILHHDDWFVNDSCLQKFVEKAIPFKNLPYLFFSSYYDCGKKRKKKKFSGFIFNKIKKNHSILLFYNFIGAPSTVFFRKKDFISFDNSTKWYVDVIFYKTFLKIKGSKCIYISEELVNIGISVNQVTNVLSNMTKFNEAIYAFDKFVDRGKRQNVFLITLKILELRSRYNIDNKCYDSIILNNSLINVLRKLKFNWKIYAIIRIIYLKYIPSLN